METRLEFQLVNTTLCCSSFLPPSSGQVYSGFLNTLSVCLFLSSPFCLPLLLLLLLLVRHLQSDGGDKLRFYRVTPLRACSQGSGTKLPEKCDAALWATQALPHRCPTSTPDDRRCLFSKQLIHPTDRPNTHRAFCQAAASGIWRDAKSRG